MTLGTSTTVPAGSGGCTGTKSGGGGLRDLLSSVAQQVESHLHPSSLAGSPRPPRTDGHSERTRIQGRRRRSRIRSWIGYHDRDRNRNNGNDADSLHFTDSDSDEFGTRAAAVDESKEKDEEKRKREHASKDATTPNQHRTQNATADAMHTLSPDEMREEETVDMLTSLMGEGFDREVARRILRKYAGDVDKAAGALLEGERGDEPGPGQTQGWPAIQGATGAASTSTSASASASAGTVTGWPPPPMQTSSQAHARAGSVGGRPNTPVIDLTVDDDTDLQRAMEASMSTQYPPSYTQTQAGPPAYAPPQGQGGHGQTQGQPGQVVFGPSERPSDPNWAVVPSQQNESHEANYLQNLNRAIEASLETMGDSDALEPFPVEQQLRRDGCPVVLRPSMHAMVYAASIIQGLFYVPQVRERMASWRPPMPLNEEELAPPMSGPDFTLWVLSEIFTHMDLARLCDLNVDKRLSAFNIEPWERPAQPPGELSRKFFARLSATLEKAFVEQFERGGQPLPKQRLLHFQYGSSTSEPGELLQETSIVPIDVNGGESSDLIGRLSAQLSKPQSEPGKQSVIFEPSAVVAFELVRSVSVPSTSATGAGVNKKPFTYPKTIYLDQFLRENVELAQTKRTQREGLLKEVQHLVLHKKTLTNFDGKDTLKDLRSTIFYFENVADPKDDLERGSSIQTTTRKLKGILTAIEDEIKSTDEKISTLRTLADTLLECEELKQYKYDLRVVFVHDGLYGRKHLYSYVQDRSCWWKIADSLIEKVPEDTVLNDQAGLHLGAGPYLLFYSRATDGPAPVLPWIDDIKDDVKAANREFLSQLPPELVADIVVDEDMSVVGAPSGPVVVKKVTGDRMDVS